MYLLLLLFLGHRHALQHSWRCLGALSVVSVLNLTGCNTFYELHLAAASLPHEFLHPFLPYSVELRIILHWTVPASAASSSGRRS